MPTSQPYPLAMAWSPSALDPISVSREKTEGRHAHTLNQSRGGPFPRKHPWSPRSLPVPLQTADLYASRVHLHARIPGRPCQASHHPRSQLPPPPPHRSSPTHSVVPGASTPTRRTQSHLQRACPARLPSSPSHPHGQVRLHSRRGPRHVGEEGARAHPRAAPRPRRAGRRRRARPAGPQTPPPSAAKTAASVPFPA